MNWAALVALVQRGLDAARLSAPELAKRLAEAAAALPPGATQDEIEAFVAQQIEIYSDQNIGAALVAVQPRLVEFFKTGEGPVQKDPTNLVG